MPAKMRATQVLNIMTGAVRARLHRHTGGMFYREGALLVEDDALDMEEIEEALEVTEDNMDEEDTRDKGLRKSRNVSIRVRMW